MVLLVVGMLVASWLLGQKHHERATGLPYEAGIASEGSGAGADLGEVLMRDLKRPGWQQALDLRTPDQV